MAKGSGVDNRQYELEQIRMIMKVAQFLKRKKTIILIKTTNHEKASFAEAKLAFYYIFLNVNVLIIRNDKVRRINKNK